MGGNHRFYYLVKNYDSLPFVEVRFSRLRGRAFHFKFSCLKHVLPLEQHKLNGAIPFCLMLSGIQIPSLISDIYHCGN